MDSHKLRDRSKTKTVTFTNYFTLWDNNTFDGTFVIRFPRPIQGVIGLELEYLDSANINCPDSMIVVLMKELCYKNSDSYKLGYGILDYTRFDVAWLQYFPVPPINQRFEDEYHIFEQPQTISQLQCSLNGFHGLPIKIVPSEDTQFITFRLRLYCLYGFQEIGNTKPTIIPFFDMPTFNEKDSAWDQETIDVETQ